MHLHLSFPHTWSVFIIHEGSSSSLPSGHKALRPLFILDGYPSRYFLIAVMKHLSRSSLREEGFILAHSFESTVHDGRWMHGGRQDMIQLMLCLQPGSRERWEQVLSSFPPCL